jgi:predicted RND superfamily exporter protein
MSDMQIEIVNVSVATVPTAKGSYQVADVAYKNKTFQDKLEGKKVMSFSNKDVFSILVNAKFGDIFNVSRVKNDKGFWDWIKLSTGNVSYMETDNNTNSESSSIQSTTSSGILKPGNVTPKSNYETAEERAAKQVLIVRQSSISSAVEFGSYNKLKDAKEIIAIAKQFETYVFGQEAVEAEITSEMGNTFDDFENNII